MDLIDNSGVGLISFFWVFPAMVVVFAGLGNGFDRRGGVVDGEFGSRMVNLGQGWWVWFRIYRLWVLDLWTLYGWTWKSIWLWVYGSISWIYRFDLLEVSMLNVLEFSVLRLIMNVGRLSLSWFGEEHEVHVLKKKKNMKIINSHVLPKN